MIPSNYLQASTGLPRALMRSVSSSNYERKVAHLTFIFAYMDTKQRILSVISPAYLTVVNATVDAFLIRHPKELSCTSDAKF